MKQQELIMLSPPHRQCMFSPDKLYRYTLWREWKNDSAANNLEYVQFIGLNPSKADDFKNDNTVSRCIQYAKNWGYGAMCMTNLFGWRETDSKKLLDVEEPIGLMNLSQIIKVASSAGLVVAAWGTKGSHMGMDLCVRYNIGMLGVKIHCLKKTKEGHPQHPLYLKKTLAPIPL